MRDLTPDQSDAILRDPNCPDDIRLAVVADWNVTRYLDSIEFYTDDSGLTHVRPVSDAPAPTPVDAPAPVAAEPAPAEPAPVAPAPEPAPGEGA